MFATLYIVIYILPNILQIFYKFSMNRLHNNPKSKKSLKSNSWLIVIIYHLSLHKQHKRDLCRLITCCDLKWTKQCRLVILQKLCSVSGVNRHQVNTLQEEKILYQSHFITLYSHVTSFISKVIYAYTYQMSNQIPNNLNLS